MERVEIFTIIPIIDRLTDSSHLYKTHRHLFTCLSAVFQEYTYHQITTLRRKVLPLKSDLLLYKIFAFSQPNHRKMH